MLYPGLWRPLAHAYLLVKERRKQVAHRWLEAEDCVMREEERLGKYKHKADYWKFPPTRAPVALCWPSALGWPVLL